MSMWLKQSTAVTVKFGPFVDATDGVTAETGLTISQADIRLSKNGGNIAQTNNATGATHDELGYYDVPLDATDTNTLGTLRVAVSESGALPVWQDFMVVPANVWDSMFGTDKLQVHVDEMTAGIITATVLANGAIDAATFAADVDAEILSYIVDDATRIDASALNTASGTSIPAILVDTGTTLDGKLDAIDTVVDAILVDTGTTLQGELDAIEAAVITNAAGVDIAADIIALKAVADAILVDTGTTLDGKIDTIDTNVDSILVDTAEIGAAGAGLTEAGGTGDHLTAINLPNQTMDITGNITGNLSGSVGSVTGAVGSVTGNVGGNVTGAVGSVASGGIVTTSFGAGAIDAAALAADAGTELADALLNRNLATGTDSGSETVRTVRQALRILRNKVSIAAGTMTVTKEDDSTASWTAEVTTAAGDPIDSIDPASA